MEHLRNLENLGKLITLVTELQKIKKRLTKKRKRACWVREVNRDRNKKGYYIASFLQIKEKDPDAFFKHTRMKKETYNLLLSLLKCSLEKTSIRKAIEPEQRLAVTLTLVIFL